MPRLRFQGPFRFRLTSLLALNRIALATYTRRAFGYRLDPSWDVNLEIGIRFWRHPFTVAMAKKNIADGRLIFDSLQTLTEDQYDVAISASSAPLGHWYRPSCVRSSATLLYLHCGGYTFHGKTSQRYAAMLAHHTGAPVFAPDYRLTPEHPHPAQRDDALEAWHHLAEETPANKIVVIGDSAGGHMALMLLQSLRDTSRPQPALCIGLCPWTDIGERGASLHGNDLYDLVQGWMALRFGQWLDPDENFGRSTLSPITHNYAGLAPIYLQAGGREILRDMICDFAEQQHRNGANVLLDLWPDMPHIFQAFDSTTASSTDALARICEAIYCYVDHQAVLPAGPHTILPDAQHEGP
jgi:epsilon-lactone hydrolase